MERISGGEYRLDLIGWHLGTLMLGMFRSSALAFERSPLLVGTSGLDHMLVQLYVQGGFTGTAGNKPVVVEPGDIVVFDLAFGLKTRTTDFCNISLLVPRPFFESTRTDLSNLHGLVLPAAAPMTAVLASYIMALTDRIPFLTMHEGDVAAKSTVALITTVLGGQDDRQPPPISAVQAPFRRIADEIDRRICDPTLDPNSLASAFGMSRATLYRTFEPVGGIAEYIRRRRLSAAAVTMTRPENRRRKIAEIAFEFGFSSESAFTRAFKLAFGVPPGVARERSIRHLPSGPGHSGANSSSDFARWMRMLRV